MLRWAVETATSDNPVRADAGLATLGALLHAEILQTQDEPLVAAGLEVVLAAASTVAYGNEKGDGGESNGTGEEHRDDC